MNNDILIVAKKVLGKNLTPGEESYAYNAAKRLGFKGSKKSWNKFAENIGNAADTTNLVQDKGYVLSFDQDGWENPISVETAYEIKTALAFHGCLRGEADNSAKQWLLDMEPIPEDIKAKIEGDVRLEAYFKLDGLMEAVEGWVGAGLYIGLFSYITNDEQGQPQSNYRVVHYLEG